MRLKSFSLRGALGVKKNLGLDQIDIDFTQFEAGIVALAGDNGTGKSTTLRNLTPYLSMGLLDGTMYTNFGLRDSHRDLTVEHGGHVYRSRILIDAPKKKTEAYLYRDGEPLAGPNVTDYKARVAEIFGSEAFFFRSAFRDQKARSFITIQKAELREFLAELLDLDHIQGYHERAKAKAISIETRIAGVRARCEALRIDTGDTSAVDAYIAGVRGEVQTHRVNIEEAETALASLRTDHQTAVLALAGFDALAKEYEVALKSQDAAEQNAETVRERLAGARREREFVLLRTSDAIAKENGVRSMALESVTAKQARAEKITANKAAIAGGLVDLAAAKAEVARHESLAEMDRTLRAELANVNEKRRAQDSALTTFKTEAAKLWADITRLTESLTAVHETKAAGLWKALRNVEEQAALTGAVPCKGTDLQAGCQLLKSAIDAGEQLPALRADYEAFRDADPLDTPEVARARADYAAHLETEPFVNQALDTDAAQIVVRVQNNAYDADAHKAAQDALAAIEAKGWPALAIEAEHAAETIRECEARIVEINAEHAARVAEIEKRHAEQTAKQAAEILALETEVAKADTEVARIDAEVSACYLKLAGRKAAEMNADGIAGTIREQEIALSGLRTSLESAQKALADAEARLAAATRAVAEADALEASIAPDTAELAEWSLLSRALAKDGVQALELDAALPGLEQIANQLLIEMPEPVYQIHFDTQRTGADGRQIEDLRIVVSSGDWTQEMQTLSGGEDVWVNAALLRAVSIYRGRKTGTRIETCFLDEADGALSEHRAVDYLAMLRRAHEIDGTHHTLIITHRQELLAHIPSQIRLVPGVGIEYAN